MNEKQLREKRDQELIEILNEVRVALAGASVLFGFLLVVPFNSGWDDATDSQRAAYVVAFLATLLSVVGLMTPTAYHRLRWRERNKERMLRFSQLGVVAGIAEMARTALALAVTAVAGAAVLLVWYALPLSGPYERWDDEVDDEELHELGSHPRIGAGTD